MHTHYPKGTPLYIRMSDGSIVIGKFKDHKSGRVILENNAEILLSKVKTMTIRKLKATTTHKNPKKIIFRADK